MILAKAIAIRMTTAQIAMITGAAAINPPSITTSITSECIGLREEEQVADQCKNKWCAKPQANKNTGLIRAAFSVRQRANLLVKVGGRHGAFLQRH